MRFVHAISALALLAACGQAAGPSTADAQPTPTTTTGAQAVQTAAFTAADRTAILSTLQLRADARGQVENECSEKVTPQFIPADQATVGAVLFVMTGGPNSASCYGDGPGLWLMRNDGAGVWREIYSSRGGYLAILSTSHRGARDLAFAGPGFEHAKYVFDGTAYQQQGTIADSAMGSATILPQ